MYYFIAPTRTDWHPDTCCWDDMEEGYLAVWHATDMRSTTDLSKGKVVTMTNLPPSVPGFLDSGQCVLIPLWEAVDLMDKRHRLPASVLQPKGSWRSQITTYPGKQD